ncbi:prohibitin 1 [Plasmodium brasilianum]|uniref:Prohibitin n=2 Tax=Plasmodium (Plasmodium) TaxID=418103 RepID=A0A1A8VSH9_PLAMA|nr:prohibitin, putative [Plasmodium malariae]KAI4839937.1 prohibitin 1 [Plasmodium brasilianum]SBS82627.1 prohibitin, putative [Plasmodium malariae]SBT74834.1 prohibitin, putative [Plasmodium malariae]SBT87306.1 prohibitin, putative [Plasmodium malariae]
MEKLLSSIGRLSVVAGGLSLIPYTFIYDVDGGERCVMFNRFGGVSENTYGEGSHFYIPWFQTPYIYDIKMKPKVINTTTGTRDLQIVTLSLRLLFRPHTKHLPYLHSTLGPDYDERVLPSIGNEVLKAVVAKYNAESLLTQRDKISKEIRESITARAKHFNILLDDVAITHLSYGKEFAKAIEDKQVAQQESERVKFIVAKTEQEKIAAVIKAQGEAEAAKLISTAVKEYGNSLLEIRKLEAAKEIAENLSKSKNVTYFPSNSNILLNPKNL